MEKYEKARLFQFLNITASYLVMILKDNELQRR